MLKSKNITADLTLIQTKRLSTEETTQLKQQYGLTQEVINYVIDRDEVPNYVYDEDSNDELFIVQIPHVLHKGQLRYITQPVGFLLHDSLIFTFNPSGEENFEKIIHKHSEKAYQTRNEFIFAALFELMDNFMPIMHNLTKERNRLDKVLNKEIKNKELIKFSHLQQTLSYFSSASALNLTMFHKLPHTHFFTPSYTGEQSAKKDMLEDVVIESEQVSRMIETELAVVGRIGDTFNTIANNNLNDTMKVLTVWSLALTIPTILTGFYGMNVGLPGAHTSYAWIMVLIFSVIIALLLLFILRIGHKL